MNCRARIMGHLAPSVRSGCAPRTGTPVLRPHFRVCKALILQRYYSSFYAQPHRRSLARYSCLALPVEPEPGKRLSVAPTGNFSAEIDFGLSDTAFLISFSRTSSREQIRSKSCGSFFSDEISLILFLQNLVQQNDRDCFRGVK